MFLKFKPNDVLLWWGQAENLQKLKQTYPSNQFVMVLGDHYYLDCGRGNKYGSNSWCDPYKNWWYIYNFEPTDYLNDGSIIGGQVAAWSEMFTEHVLHSIIWPRIASLTDRYWSPKQAVDLTALTSRLTAFKETLIDMGIPASPIADGYCEITNKEKSYIFKNCYQY